MPSKRKSAKTASPRKSIEARLADVGNVQPGLFQETTRKHMLHLIVHKIIVDQEFYLLLGKKQEINIEKVRRFRSLIENFALPTNYYCCFFW